MDSALWILSFSRTFTFYSWNPWLTCCSHVTVKGAALWFSSAENSSRGNEPWINTSMTETELFPTRWTFYSDAVSYVTVPSNKRILVPVNVYLYWFLSNWFLWAAGTWQRWWRLWRCKWTQRYRKCWSWFGRPVSSGSPPGPSPPPPSPTGLLPLVWPVLRAAAEEPVVQPLAWSPAASSPLTNLPQPAPVRAPAVPAAARGTPAGTLSFGC